LGEIWVPDKEGRKYRELTARTVGGRTYFSHLYFTISKGKWKNVQAREEAESFHTLMWEGYLSLIRLWREEIEN